MNRNYTVIDDLLAPSKHLELGDAKEGDDTAIYA